MSPFATSASSVNSDLMKFTPRVEPSDNLISFTPSQPAQTNGLDHTIPIQPAEKLIQITPESIPETSVEYLRHLELKAEALKNDIDAKISKAMAADKGLVEIDGRISANNSEHSILSSRLGNLSDLNISSLSDDGLDLSQDLDSLIERLKHMNAQTLAVSSQKMGLTPKRIGDEANVSLENIKNILEVDSKPTDAATEILEEYNRKSSFSPSQLLPEKNESFITNGLDETSEEQKIPQAVSAVEITSQKSAKSPPASSNNLSAQFPRRISGELISGFTGANGSGKQRAVSPNPLSPRRLKEEIKRCTPCDESAEDTLSTTQSSCSPDKSTGLANRLDISTPKSNVSLSSTANFPSPPNAASSPTKPSSSLLSASPGSNKSSIIEESPEHDKAYLINQFLADNPHYLQKISESLSCASLPSFPTSPTQVTGRTESQDDIKADSKPVSPPVNSKPRSPPSGNTTRKSCAGSS